MLCHSIMRTIAILVALRWESKWGLIMPCWIRCAGIPGTVYRLCSRLAQTVYHAGERNWKPFFTATILPSFEIVVPQFTSSSFYVSFLSRVNSTNWPAPNIWVFIAQLVEHCSVNAEAIGLNPVKVQKFFSC